MIKLHKVGKVYRLYSHPTGRLREALPFASSRHKEFWAVRDVSLSVPRGEVLALVGPNGSGKSTVLQIVAGILEPTLGSVRTDGRIAALLELGAGFNPEFTGRENVFLNGEILGLTRRQVEAAFPRIEAFAGIGEFIDRPVKEYSSGMYVRLAFSTAIHVDPEILIVDEALAVGDAIFASRCIQKFEELRERGVTVLFVSHDLGLVKRLAHRAVLLWEGRVAAEGHPRDVVNRYVGLVLERQRREEGRSTGPAVDASFRHGDGSSRILDIALLGANGERTTAVESGERITVRIRARYENACDAPVAGMLIRNRHGMDIYGTNTRIEQIPLGPCGAGDEIEVDFTFDCLLARHEYTLTVATQHWDGTSQDWLDDALAFTVVEPKELAGVVHLRPQVSWRKAEHANR
ncbi:MAG TPA: ABC transporter ATP-binding protein [Solibacterales bacterium]|nr:ABC transporter ATP-binding protein [Bryobacterales bacterium]